MKRLILNAALIATTFTALLPGQTRSDPNPRLGLQPTGIYSLSDIETINQTNGNLSLRIPLGSLGPDRAGASHGFALGYNSKIWEGAITQAPYGGGDVSVNSLRQSSTGGWRYQMGYDLELTGRDGVDVNNCTPPEPVLFYYKLQVVFPDGSKHLLRQESQSGFVLSGVDNFGDGYYMYKPDGKNGEFCGQSPLQMTGPVVYYTTDGTFLRLVVSHDSSSPPKTSWVLSFSNGDYVLGGNGPDFLYRPQSICDRNDNCVQLEYQFQPGSASFVDAYFGSMHDEFDRTIQVAYGGVNLTGGPDTVTVPGFGGTSLTWTVNWTWFSTSAPTAPQYDCPPATCSEGLGQYMVTGVVPPVVSGLPPYSFSFSGRWGELSSVTLPSGSTANYTYWLDSNAAAAGCDDTLSGFPAWYDVLANYPCKKNLYWDGNTGHAPDEVSSFILIRTPSTYYTTYGSSIFTDSSGGVTTTKFYPYAYAVGPYPGNWQSGLVYEIDGPALGETVTRQWAQNPLPGMTFPYDSHNVYIQSETRSVTGTGGTSIAQTTHTVDRNGNPLVTAEYDWPAGASLIRQTAFTYYNGTSDASVAPTQNEPNLYWNTGAARVLSLPRTKQVDGSTTPSSFEQYCYDNSETPTVGNLSIHARLLSGAPGGTLVTCSSGAVAGNAIATKVTHGTGGIVTVSMDARGVATKFQYDSNNLYVTERDEACNQSLSPGQTCSLAEARKTEYGTDLNTGKVTRIKDLDNSTVSLVQSITGYDWFGRPTSITDATGLVTTISYHDSNPKYQMTTTPMVVSANCFDQMDRLSLQQTSESHQLTSPCSTEGITSRLDYASGTSGRYEWVSNPTRGAGETTMGWTRRTYDNAGRLSEEATFSGYTSPGQSYNNLTGKKTWSYDGTCYTVSDQAANAPTQANPGAVLKTCMDAAGRIVKVTETTATGTQDTTYAYDGLNNLTDVYQGTQHRMFRYDPLGRLTSANNPENGLTTYGYDNNGNVIRKTDARNVSSCFGPVSGTQCNAGTGYGANNAYDGLNRPATKAYTDGSTPPVTYSYSQDLSGSQPNYPKGRLTSIAAGGTTIDFNRFDAAGRTLQYTQTTTGAAASPYVFHYHYTGGVLDQVTYPSNRVITTTYDLAGRPGSVAGQLGGVTTNYAGPPAGQTYIQYAPQGAVSAMNLGKVGTGAWTLSEQHGYNARLQSTSISLLTAGGNTIRSLTYGYGGTENNGNLLSQTITGNGVTGSLIQAYTYDRLNRVKSVAEGAPWSRGFDYDRYGNGWVSSYLGIAPGTFTPRSGADFDATTNRTIVNGATPDLAGNQLGIGGYQFTYDAENRLVRSVLTAATAYQYDGEGRRVTKIDCLSAVGTCDSNTPGATVTWYVYDVNGELAAEYASSPAAAPCTTCYVMADHLGSTRVKTDQNGTAVECHDYLPFGEEILGGANGRSTGCYSAAMATGMLFTGKIRDSWDENNGLDYFGARYFSGAQGRMTSPDPFMIMTQAENREQLDAYLGNPQNWNRYAYALNNPLRYIDPTGLDPISIEDCQKDSSCTVVKVNIVLDANAAIFDKDGNLQQQYQEKLDSQEAAAADEYGNANIALDFHTTTAAVDSTYVGEKSAITVVVTDSRDSYSSYSWLGASGASYTRLNIGTSQTNTIAHEFSHHLTGDTRSFGIPYLSNAISDYNNDMGRAVLRNWNTTAGKILRTVDPFLYLHRRDIMQNARNWYGGR